MDPGPGRAGAQSGARWYISAALSFFKRLFSADYRAARSAEAAGHLEQAAEHYALAGEHTEAARVHLARSERAASRNERIAALRDALHWVGEHADLQRRIHKHLGRTMWEQVQAEGIATQRDRDRVREAAKVLIKGGDYKRAGQAYESIDALQEAALAYKQGGLVELMEQALAHEEERISRKRSVREGFANYKMHMRIGSRDAARDDLREALAAANKKGEYRRLLDELESRLITGGVVSLRRRQGPTATACALPVVTMGRDNLCELALRAGGISRQHTEITVADASGASDEDARFHIRDAGSKNGTFVGGMPVDGSVPLIDTGSFALGEYCTIEFRVSDTPAHLCLHVDSGMDRGRTLIAGGPDEVLDIGQFFDLPVAIVFRDGRPYLHRRGQVDLELGNETVAHGEVQLIHGDQLRIAGDEIEVL